MLTKPYRLAIFPLDTEIIVTYAIRPNLQINAAHERNAESH